MLIGRVLRAGRIGVRDPYGGQAQRVGEDFVRQRAAEVWKDRGLLAGGALDRADGPFYPRRIWIEARGVKDGVARGLELHVGEAVAVEMAPQRREDVVRVDADHVAQLAGRARARRDRVHRTLGVAGDEGEHLEAAPAEDALGRRQAGFAPVRVDARALGTRID